MARAKGCWSLNGICLSVDQSCCFLGGRKQGCCQWKRKETASLRYRDNNGRRKCCFPSWWYKNHPFSIAGEHFSAFPRVLQHFAADNVLCFGKRRNKGKEWRLVWVEGGCGCTQPHSKLLKPPCSTDRRWLWIMVYCFFLKDSKQSQRRIISHCRCWLCIFYWIFALQ